MKLFLFQSESKSIRPHRGALARRAMGMGGGRGIRFSSHDFQSQSNWPSFHSVVFQMGFLHIKCMLGGLFEKDFCCFHDNLLFLHLINWQGL